MEEFESALGMTSPTSGFIPESLSFERIVKNETAVPCSLNDFMDYLVYVEHQAEDLQFFLWYYNFIPRWNALMPRQKALSPAWEPGTAKGLGPKSRFFAYRHKRARSDKMNKILAVLDAESEKKADEIPFQCPPIKTSFSPDDDFARPGTPPPRPVEPPKPDWFTVQPFRNEYCGIVKHYIVETSPRALKLSKEDREWCLQAAPHTTHPSALLPAFLAVEDNLRNRLYPNFIRWTRSNSNPASMIFLRTVGVVLFLLGAGLDTVLILSRQSNFLRILCLVFWWPGLTVFMAAWKNVCLILHYRDVRELRPWEIFPSDNETGVKDVYIPSPVSAAEKESGIAGIGFLGQHARKNTGDSTVIGTDPLRKPSMRTFGPKNDYNVERWYNLYRKRSLFSKILDQTTPVQNATLRQMQDRTIFLAVLWGGLVSTALTIGSLLVPSIGIIR